MTQAAVKGTRVMADNHLGLFSRPTRTNVSTTGASGRRVRLRASPAQGRDAGPAG